MKHFKDYKRVIAITEHSAGNAETGNSWIETKSFAKSTPISKIVEWAKYAGGKLIITIDEGTTPKSGKNLPF